MANPRAAMVVIGDEILNGRTRDANMHYLANELFAKGIDLGEVRIVSDVHGEIISAINALRSKYDHVFTSGGIGPTHDDITADAMAAAFSVSIDIRADARALLQAHYDRLGTVLNEARLRMARIPDGAILIDNPVSTAPGFSLGNVHVMAGVPAVFKAMVASVLPKVTGGTPLTSRSIRVLRGEGELATPLAALAQHYPEISIGSYPFQKDGLYGAQIVFRGTDPDVVNAAAAVFSRQFSGVLSDDAQ